MKRSVRGTALLLVLWATALLATILMGVAVAARSQGGAALYGSERVRAQLAAEAGLAHAVSGLHATAAGEHWTPDGRPYTFDFGGAQVTVRVVDVSGLVDVNAVSPDLLHGVFAAAGIDSARANRLADAVVQARGGPSAATRRSGAGTHPAGAFRALDELARVPGMDADLYTLVAPALTVFSGRNFPDPSYAGPLALAALRGIDVRQATALVAARRGRPASRDGGAGLSVGAGADAPLVAGRGGSLVRVFSSATMPDGVRAGIDVSLRMALTEGSVRPYKVLAWRDEAPGGAGNGAGHGNSDPTIH